MPRHHGGGVTNLSGIADGLPKGGQVRSSVSTRPGPKGHPKAGKGVPSSPAAAAKQGEQQAKQPRS